MSAEEYVFGILSADAGVAALVGDRVFPELIPEELPVPAIVYLRASTEPITTIHGPTVGEFVTFGIQCWAKTSEDSGKVADAVEAAIKAAGEAPSNRLSSVDDATGLSGVSIDLRVFVA